MLKTVSLLHVFIYIFILVFYLCCGMFTYYILTIIYYIEKYLLY